MAYHRRTQSRQQRDPPPSLFLHPSPAGSHVELPGILAPGAPVPGPSGGLSNERPLNPSSSSLSIHSANGPQRGTRSIESSRTADRTDALWAEMQATLQEVELSASGGTHVFGPEHDRKLNELRAAQIALAQAWARSEADEVIETAMQENMTATAGTADHHNLKTAFGDASKSAGEGTDAAKSTVQSNSARPMSRGKRWNDSVPSWKKRPRPIFFWPESVEKPMTNISSRLMLVCWTSSPGWRRLLWPCEPLSKRVKIYGMMLNFRQKLSKTNIAGRPLYKSRSEHLSIKRAFIFRITA
ncbi:hypothetical protein V2G26_015865 [Clonostachys chloroleuca]